MFILQIAQSVSGPGINGTSAISISSRPSAKDLTAASLLPMTSKQVAEYRDKPSPLNLFSVRTELENDFGVDVIENVAARNFYAEHIDELRQLRSEALGIKPEKAKAPAKTIEAAEPKVSAAATTPSLLASTKIVASQPKPTPNDGEQQTGVHHHTGNRVALPSSGDGNGTVIVGAPEQSKQAAASPRTSTQAKEQAVSKSQRARFWKGSLAVLSLVGFGTTFVIRDAADSILNSVARIVSGTMALAFGTAAVADGLTIATLQNNDADQPYNRG